MIESLIGAGASVLGGLLGGDEGVTPDEQSRLALLGQAQGARQASQVHGFNPLTLLGVSQPMPGIAPQNYMGSAIADAGLLLADGIKAQSAEKKALEVAKTENEKLRKKVEQMTIRPKMGGVYAQRVATPSLSEGLGGGHVPGFRPGTVVAPVEIQTLPNDPDLISAQSSEDQFGEVGGVLDGTRNMFVTAYRNSVDPMRERPKVRPKAKPMKLFDFNESDWFNGGKQGSRQDGVTYGDGAFVYGF